MDKNIHESFLKNLKKGKTGKEKTMKKYGVKNYSATSSKDQLFGLGHFDEVDEKEIAKRLTKGFGAALSHNTIKAQSNRAIKTFPIIVSDKIDPQLVYTFKNIFEENYAQYISLLISNQVVDLGEYNIDDKDGSSIAIKVLDDLSSTNLKGNKIAQKASNTGKVSASDFLGGAAALLGFNEDMKTGNEMLDMILEDAIICESENEYIVENMLQERMDEILQEVINLDGTDKPKFELPDYFGKEDKFQNNRDVDLSKFLNYTVANELNDKQNYEMKEKFIIASKLMGARKISGSEFLSYTYHLGIPVPTNVSTEVLKKFPISAVKYAGNDNFTLGDMRNIATKSNNHDKYITDLKEIKKKLSDNTKRVANLSKELDNIKNQRDDILNSIMSEKDYTTLTPEEQTTQRNKAVLNYDVKIKEIKNQIDNIIDLNIMSEFLPADVVDGTRVMNHADIVNAIVDVNKKLKNVDPNYNKDLGRATGNDVYRGLNISEVLSPDDYIVGDMQIKAMYSSKRLVINDVVRETLAVNLKDVVYSYVVSQANKKQKQGATVGGLGVGTGIAGVVSAVAGAAPVVAGIIGSAGVGGLGVGLAMFLHGMFKKARAKKNKDENKVVDQLESDVLDATDSLYKNTDNINTTDINMRTKLFNKLKTAYDGYLKELRSIDPDKYYKVIEQDDGSDENMFLKLHGGNVAVKKNDSNVFNTSISLTDASKIAKTYKDNYVSVDMEPWERVEALIESYRAQRRSNSVDELKNSLFKSPLSSSDNSYFKNIKQSIFSLSQYAESDAYNNLDSFLKSSNKSLNTVDKEYDSTINSIASRVAVNASVESYNNEKTLNEAIEDYNNSKFKFVNLFESIDSGFVIPKKLLEEIKNSKDEEMISFCEAYSTVEERKAQQATIKKILSTTPLKQYEYDEVQGKAMFAPAFMGAKDYVYGSVEYDARSQEKRRFGSPLMLKISFKKRYDDDRATDNDLTAYIGIQGEIITIPSEEMEYILQTNAEGQTSGSFLKNFVTGKFDAKKAISDIFINTKVKRDVKNLPVSAEIWQNLESVSKRVVANKIAGKSNGNVANAQFLFSDVEVSNLRNKTNVDYYRDINLAKQFMEKYSALTMAIVNESTERVNMLDDPDSVSWSIVPLGVIRGADTTSNIMASISALQGRRI